MIFWAFPPLVEAAVRLSAHTPWALGPGRYPLQSLTRNFGLKRRYCQSTRFTGVTCSSVILKPDFNIIRHLFY